MRSIFKLVTIVSVALLLGGCMTHFREPRCFESETVSEELHLVKLQEVGYEALLSRIHLIRSAKNEIMIQTFIWDDDEVGRLIFYELLQAARRGVNVRIIADQMFSPVEREGLAVASIAHPNLKIRLYKPSQNRIESSVFDHLKTFLLSFRKANIRMHNKLFIADDWAITGGRNIQDCYYDRAAKLNFKDRDILVKGPVVEKMKDSFEEYWRYRLVVSSSKLKDVASHIKKHTFGEEYTPEVLGISNIYTEVSSQLDDNRVVAKLYDELFPVKRVAFFADPPNKNKSFGMSGSSRLNEALAYCVSESCSSVVIQSPYLVMTKRAKRIFRKLRKRRPHVEITFSTNSLAATDSWPTYALFYKQKKMLLDDLNATVFEFKPIPSDLLEIMPVYPTLLKRTSGMEYPGQLPAKLNGTPYLCLHAKTLVVDKEFSFVGSYNFDPRSANLNTEVGLVVWDSAFSQSLYARIATDCAARNSWATWKKTRVIGLSHLDDLLSAVSGVVESVTTLDLWPSSNASCFALKPGAVEVGTDHPDFYEEYMDVGNFPMVPITDEKAVLVQLFRSLGQALAPLL